MLGRKNEGFCGKKWGEGEWVYIMGRNNGGGDEERKEGPIVGNDDDKCRSV